MAIEGAVTRPGCGASVQGGDMRQPHTTSSPDRRDEHHSLMTPLPPSLCIQMGRGALKCGYTSWTQPRRKEGRRKRQRESERERERPSMVS